MRACRSGESGAIARKLRTSSERWISSLDAPAPLVKFCATFCPAPVLRAVCVREVRRGEGGKIGVVYLHIQPYIGPYIGHEQEPHRPTPCIGRSLKYLRLDATRRPSV